jgi:hypothetical protein
MIGAVICLALVGALFAGQVREVGRGNRRNVRN